MMRLPFRLAVPAAAGLVLLLLALSAALIVQTTRRTAQEAAATAVQTAAHLAQNALNRHFLRVDGALASLPALMTANAGPGGKVEARAATRVLRSFNFQTFSFRDLMLLHLDGTTWATARPRGGFRPLPVSLDELSEPPSPGSMALGGPARNPSTGDWTLFVARRVSLPVVGPLLAVAEVPVPLLTELLAEVSEAPGVRFVVQRHDGRVLATLPHEEARMALREPPVADRPQLDGIAFPIARAAAAEPAIGAARPTLYGDVTVLAVLDTKVALAAWARDRDRIAAGVIVASLLVLALAGAVYHGFGQHERLETVRARARLTLENAIEAMADGFVMWDREDRLVTCNQRYLELYAKSAPFIRPGAPFETIIRAGAEHGQYPQAGDDIEGFVREVVAWHRGNHGAVERLLPDGRWLLVTERRTADGGTVGIRTDITALKAAQAELARANERSRQAVLEAERQNAILTERESRIRYLAHHDALTGLPNRTLFRIRLEEALASRGGTRSELALFYLDLDRFKQVNDTLGHSAGDALLTVVAERLRACVAEAEIVARLSGDEFALVCLARDAAAASRAIAERVIAVLSAPYEVGGRVISVGVSIGVAIAGGSEETPESLLKDADIALYAAKDKGRGVFCMFEGAMAAQLQARLSMEEDLRAGLELEQFEVAYQPVFDLRTSRLCGFEALLRWNHPRRGCVSPAEFVPIAEELGLIGRLGSWVLERACADMANLPARLRVAVNLSPVQLRADDLLRTVTRALERSGLEPGRLELELTESALLFDDARTRGLLYTLRELGLRLVLDDFGTGFSSLSHLRTFPFNKIKIDKSFIKEMTHRSDCLAIVRSVVDLADQLGMTSTAEGVETRELLDLVRRIGCVEAQGYHLGRPGPLLEAVATVARDEAGRAVPGQTAGRALRLVT